MHVFSSMMLLSLFLCLSQVFPVKGKGSDVFRRTRNTLGDIAFDRGSESRGKSYDEDKLLKTGEV
jgi:hypothetical protein